MQKNIINKWLENSYNKNRNQEIIILKISTDYSQYNMIDLSNSGKYNSSNVNVMIDAVPQYRNLSNQIIVTNSLSLISLEWIKKVVQKKIILIEDINSINKIVSLLKNKELDFNNEIKYTLLEKIKFEDVLLLDSVSLKNFVLSREAFLNKLNKHFIAIDYEHLDSYINLYVKSKLLVANFAHTLYTLSTLDFISTQKAVGANIHKIVGVGSKVINLESKNIVTVSSLRKNIRVYDLNSNQIETKTKLDIAKKLLLLNYKDLDVQKIAKTLELPLKQVEKIYSKHILK